MNKILSIILFTFWNIMFPQSAFYNAGNIEIHDGGQIGFHTDLKNDGNFNGNKGLVGFYNTTDALFIYGSEEVVFHDLEVVVLNDLELLTSVEIKNTLNFIDGKIKTPRSESNINLSFTKDAIYSGNNDSRYIDGYAAVRSNMPFVFPIGDDNRLRPVSIESNIVSQEFKAAYFFEDVNFSPTLSKSFNTEVKQNSIFNISNDEFWDVNGKSPVSITLTWDELSNINDLTNHVNNLIVVGWSKTDNKWEDLGKVGINGDLFSGSIKSTIIFPDDYEVFTIASRTHVEDPIYDLENVSINQIRLFDITRRLIKTFGSNEKIDFQGIAKGVYIADFYLSNGTRYSKKVLNK